MTEQHNSLENVLETWQTGHQQVDNILVMGVRI